MSGSGKLNQPLIDAVAKGHLTLKEADTLLNSKSVPSSAQLELLALQHTSALSKKFVPSCSLCGQLCGFVWYVKRRQLPPADTSLTHALKVLGNTVVACGECHQLDMSQFEASTFKQLVGADSIEADSDEEQIEFSADDLRKMIVSISDMETLDWEKVAEAVGNGASSRDCLFQFVQLPLAEELNDCPPKDEEDASTDQSARKPQTIFEDDTSPLLS